MLLSPQAVVSRDTGISIAGQPDRLNGLQIDGASAVDLGGIHGISGFGTPAAASGIRVLPIEAIKDLQVLIAPFDVRYSGFAGGLVNAVTRSGANRWEGSVSTYFQNQSLTGKDSVGDRAEEFSTKELAVTLGGPIVRDRAAFFVDVGIQRFVGTPGPSIGTDTTGGADSVGFGVRRAELVRFRDILRNTYHVEPGSFGSTTFRESVGERPRQGHAVAGAEPAHRALAQPLGGHVQRRDRGVRDVIPQQVEPATFNDSRATWTVGARRAHQRADAGPSRRDAALSPRALPFRRSTSRWGQISIPGYVTAGVRERVPRSIRQPDDLGADRQRVVGHGRRIT